MNIGFYLTFPQGGDDCTNYVLADILLRSIRLKMPGMKVTQFTDSKSPGVYGVDEVRRKPNAPLPLLRSAHFADVDGDWLFLDTDIVIQADVRSVFDDSFDIALCDRESGPAVDEEFARQMPHNVGVIFSRSKNFWQTVHDRVREEKNLDPWLGDQKIICELANGGEYNFKVLSGKFNHTPAEAKDDTGHAAIVHYKGNRKEWMLTRL